MTRPKLSARLKAKRARAKKQDDQLNRLAQRLADAADKEGLTPMYLAGNKDLCRKYRINQARLTGALVHRATERLREQISETMQRLAALYHQRGAPDPDPESDELRQRVEALLDAKPSKRKRSPAKTGAKQRVKIFDQPATAILRWMGKHDWKIADAMAVLKHFGADVAESTCKIQIKAGKTGDRGAPAKLTSTQAKQLKDLRP